MNTAPATIRTTPIQRTTDTLSPKNQMAAKVANTKLNPVNGQRKLMSLLDIKMSRQRKNNASKKTPSRICGFVAPALQTRRISPTVMPFMSPMCVMPFFSNTTPVDSKVRPTSKIKSSLSILQILVTNQFDAEFFDQFLHARTDQGIELMLKFIQRWMRVKLR